MTHLPTVPDCVVCRRQLCADAASCAGELADLCRRVAARPVRHYLPPDDRGCDGDAIYGRRPVPAPPDGWWTSERSER